MPACRYRLLLQERRRERTWLYRVRPVGAVRRAVIVEIADRVEEDVTSGYQVGRSETVVRVPGLEARRVIRLQRAILVRLVRAGAVPVEGVLDLVDGEVALAAHRGTGLEVADLVFVVDHVGPDAPRDEVS